MKGGALVSEAVPDVILEIRYHSTFNFVGERVDGYNEPVAILTCEAADALKKASDAAMVLGARPERTLANARPQARKGARAIHAGSFSCLRVRPACLSSIILLEVRRFKLLFSGYLFNRPAPAPMPPPAARCALTARCRELFSGRSAGSVSSPARNRKW